MFARMYFGQSCPVCGRPLRIAVELLGCDVVCEHCHGRFTAADPSNPIPRDSRCADQALLLVDANREHLATMARRLTELGYHVTPVHHPRQALEAATIKAFRAVLMDGSLPEIDGIELGRRLQRHISEVRIIVMVEQNQMMRVQPGTIDECWTLLKKPCSIRRLETCLAEAISETRTSSAKGSTADTAEFQLGQQMTTVLDIS